MPYSVNRSVDQIEFARHHTKEQFYMSELRKRGMLIEIENVFVDAEQLVLRTFLCDTNYCVKCTNGGSSKTYKGSCCTDLAVDITPPEKEKLVEMAKLAKEKLTFAANDPIRRVVENVLNDKISEVNEEHEEVLLHHPTGRCIMSWLDGDTLRCSINTLCSRLDLQLTEFKPDPCYLFPLHYSEFAEGQYLVSVLSTESRYWIAQHACVGKLRCLSRPAPGAPPAYIFLRGEIEYLLGKRFYRALDALAQPILERYHADSTTNGTR